MGAGVNEAQLGAGPAEFEPLLDESEDGASMHRVDADGEAVLVTRSAAGEVCAIANTCSHFGGALPEGERKGNVVMCPWHGSRFNLCGSGQVKCGPQVFPRPGSEARSSGDKIEVRRARN
jgi:nitrite reductase/ring-hydroxylating ferredoxin subunit